MTLSTRRRRHFFLPAVAAWTIVVFAFALHHVDEESLALSHFFEKMDGNHDGQVDELEAKRYIGEQIGGHDFDSPRELKEAFQHMVTNMDTDDVDVETPSHTITQEEVKQHLQNLQHAVSVKEWVQHGLELPQYAESFRKNVITAADFPLLVNNDGRVLAEELHISKQLHRNQIVRGMKRLILGLGELPSAPQIIKCWSETATQTIFQWEAPMKSGQPSVHKYVIESLKLDRQDMSWAIVSEVEAFSQRQYMQRVEHEPGKHVFRIVAWTSYGHSPYAGFSECLPSPPSSSDKHSMSTISPSTSQEVGLYGHSIDQIVTHEMKNEGEATNAGPSISQITALHGHSVSQSVTHGMKNEKEATKAGYWSIIVIAVTVALRILTSKNIAIFKCCFLSELENLASSIRLHDLAQRLARIERTECAHCKKHHCSHKPESHVDSYHPPLGQNKTVSHKIGPTQHFDVDEAHMVASKSSPNLGEDKTDYPASEWDTNEAVMSVEKLAIPDYPGNAWDDSEGPSSSQSLHSQSSTATDVQVELVEGQCAFEGCVRQWKGLSRFRNRWSRHFCSVCLRTYCYEHTYFSSHGSFGYCGQQSSCVCQSCFPRLSPATQAQLEATNRLDKSPAKKAALERGCSCRDKQTYGFPIRGLKRFGNRISRMQPERHKSRETVGLS